MLQLYLSREVILTVRRLPESPGGVPSTERHNVSPSATASSSVRKRWFVREQLFARLCKVHLKPLDGFHSNHPLCASRIDSIRGEENMFESSTTCAIRSTEDYCKRHVMESKTPLME